jgi:hypothetical protein
MKLNKTIFIMCIAILSVLTIAQLSHAYTMMVNLNQSTDGNGVIKTVEDEVGKAAKTKNINTGEDGKTIGSNENIENATLASNETTLFEAKPSLFAESMIGTINLPASELQTDGAIRNLADFITAGAEGKNVIILGETKEQVDSVKNKLTQILRLEGIDGERLFFAISTNPSIINAVRDLFTRSKGAFGLCTGDNLDPAVREDLKGAV